MLINANLYLNQQCCLSAIHAPLLSSNLDEVKATLETIKATINSDGTSNLKTEKFSYERALTLITILDDCINDCYVPSEIIRGCKAERTQVSSERHFNTSYPFSKGYIRIPGGDHHGFAVRNDEKKQVITYSEDDVVIELTAYSQDEYEHELCIQTRFYVEGS